MNAFVDRINENNIVLNKQAQKENYRKILLLFFLIGSSRIDVEC